jgi:hypothetical protein
MKFLTPSWFIFCLVWPWLGALTNSAYSLYQKDVLYEQALRRGGTKEALRIFFEDQEVFLKFEKETIRNNLFKIIFFPWKFKMPNDFLVLEETPK